MEGRQQTTSEGGDRVVARSRAERATWLQTPEPEAKIWRHMDFTKFVFMLEERALFFSRADHLVDPFEGRAGNGNLEDEGSKTPLGEQSHETTSLPVARQRFFINSWHINEHESTAMWKLFAKSDDAIAVESTYERLRASLPEYLDAEGEPRAGHIDVALVKYVDPRRGSEKLPFEFCEFLRKRKEFEHERELRAFFDLARGEGNTRKVDLAEEAGRLVDVDLDELMVRIHLAPGSSAWYRGLVERLVRRFGFATEARPSDLEPFPMSSSATTV
jgi:hypothetical protein